MKPHIVLKLKNALTGDNFPHWTSALKGGMLVEKFHPPIDSLMFSHNASFLATHEYKPKFSIWSEDEMKSGLDRVYRLILRKEKSIPPGLVDAISLLPDVEEIRAGEIGVSELPPVQASQMNVNTNKESRDTIYLDEAHRLTMGDPSVTIAVLDTGVSLGHPELKHAMLPGYDFVDIIHGASQYIGDFIGADEDPSDEVGHGTHVTGIIAGKGVNMPVGVVPRCKVLPVRVLAAMKQGNRKVGAGLVDNINAGVKWAVDQGADVINMSLGVKHTGGGLPHKEVVDYAKLKGVTIVAAAGNNGRKDLYYPGAFKSVIAVGAIEDSGDVAAFSTYGPQVSLVAPGSNIYSSFLNDNYAFSSGTSQAAPFVAGAAAMLKSFARSKGRDLSPQNIKSILVHTADRAGKRFKDLHAGFGRLNLIDSLKYLNYKLA